MRMQARMGNLEHTLALTLTPAHASRDCHSHVAHAHARITAQRLRARTHKQTAPFPPGCARAPPDGDAQQIHSGLGLGQRAHAQRLVQRRVMVAPVALHKLRHTCAAQSHTHTHAQHMPKHQVAQLRPCIRASGTGLRVCTGGALWVAPVMQMRAWCLHTVLVHSNRRWT